MTKGLLALFPIKTVPFRFRLTVALLLRAVKAGHSATAAGYARELARLGATA